MHFFPTLNEETQSALHGRGPAPGSVQKEKVETGISNINPNIDGNTCAMGKAQVPHHFLQMNNTRQPSMQVRGEMTWGVAALWPFWSAVAHNVQQQDRRPGQHNSNPMYGSTMAETNRRSKADHGHRDGMTNDENKHFSMKLNSAIGHLLRKQELSQAPSVMRPSKYDNGDTELDPTSGYDAWSSSCGLRSMEDDDLSDPGDPKEFVEHADKKEVERNRCKLAEFLRRERICAQQMLDCHQTFRRSETDARVKSIERVCAKEIHEVQCQIESLKHKLMALEQQRDEMMADTTWAYEEMGQRLRKDADRVAKAQRKLRACAGQDYITARENVASVMAFCRQRIEQSDSVSLPLKSGAPISVGPEVPALRAEAAEDSVEAVLKAAKEAQATGAEFLHADAAVQRWVITGRRPSTKDVLRWLRTNAKLAKALGDRLLDLTHQASEMDFFDKVEAFARKCSLLVLENTSDKKSTVSGEVDEQPCEHDDAVSSDSEPAQGQDNSGCTTESRGRIANKRRRRSVDDY